MRSSLRVKLKLDRKKLGLFRFIFIYMRKYMVKCWSRKRRSSVKSGARTLRVGGAAPFGAGLSHRTTAQRAAHWRF